MNSLPEFDVQPERDRHGDPTGRYVWEVFDAETNGPITAGIESTMSKALQTGRAQRLIVESSGLYCDECEGYEWLGDEACLGCCGRR